MIHILLPAYNEGRALGPVIEGIARALADGGYKVFVVDDGSSDDTAAVASRMGAEGHPVTLIRHERNQGLGAAFRTGLARVLPLMKDGDFLVTLDADNTQPPSLIPSLVAPLEEGRADMAIASRFVRGGRVVGVPLFRRFTSWAARLVFTAVFHVPGVRDYTCGFRAFRAELIKSAAQRWGDLVTEDGFACAVEWLLKVAALSPRIVEAPLVLRYDRKPGASKMNVFSTIRRSLSVVYRLRSLRA